MKIEKKIEIPQELISSLKQATRVAVLTGAGISAESGLKTFRDAHPSTSTGQGSGHWSQYRPDDLATPQAFIRDPKLVWDWYAMRRGKVAEAPGIMPSSRWESISPNLPSSPKTWMATISRPGARRSLSCMAISSVSNVLMVVV